MKTILWSLAIIIVAVGLGKCLSSPLESAMTKRAHAWEQVK